MGEVAAREPMGRLQGSGAEVRVIFRGSVSGLRILGVKALVCARSVAQDVGGRWASCLLWAFPLAGM